MQTFNREKITELIDEMTLQAQSVDRLAINYTIPLWLFTLYLQDTGFCVEMVMAAMEVGELSQVDDAQQLVNTLLDDLRVESITECQLDPGSDEIVNFFIDAAPSVHQLARLVMKLVSDKLIPTELVPTDELLDQLLTHFHIRQLQASLEALDKSADPRAGGIPGDI